MAAPRHEWRRAYGSDARVVWMQSRPCIFCGEGPCDNAHVTNGGTGRKADAEFIVPACTRRYDYTNSKITLGCHFQMDQGIGKKAMERKYGLNLLEEAAKIEALWQEGLV